MEQRLDWIISSGSCCQDEHMGKKLCKDWRMGAGYKLFEDDMDMKKRKKLIQREP
jgi:hypothetical protein